MSPFEPMISYPAKEASALDHELSPYLAELAQFESTREMEASLVYATLKPEIEKVLGAMAQENFARTPSSNRENSMMIRATAWNIERGIRLDAIIGALEKHPSMKGSDLLLLTELDYGMARTGNLNITREIARALGLNYVFAPCYLALTKGCGLEKLADGDNTFALHGNALLSRYPLIEAHSIALPNGKDKMKGEEKRLGCQRAVVAEVDHPRGRFRAVSLHLDAHSSLRHRKRQMRLMLDHLDSLTPKLPVLIGGDWNTSTYNSQRAFTSILGYFRRVAMGVRNVSENHYPYPDRWFERGLFKDLRRRGYNYRDMNEPGACTLHYDVADMAANKNMGEWLPQWCFKFIYWALKGRDGRCSFKLDWFAGRGISVYPDLRPHVVYDLADSAGALSDHDPIVLDFTL